MRQGRRARWIRGALGGLMVIASTVGGSGSQCDHPGYPDAAEHIIAIQVVDAAQHPMDGVLVTAWVVDVDQPGTERAPIVVGTSTTDAEGLVEFSYASVTPPYVCGFRVMDATSNILADHPPTTSDQLSTPSGQLTVVVP